MSSYLVENEAEQDSDTAGNPAEMRFPEIPGAPFNVAQDRFHSFASQRNRLATILPNGRFVRDVDGTCILTARRAADASAHLFEHTPGKVVGLFYVGGSCRYLRALRGLVVHHQEGDGEGIIHIAWTPEIAVRLPSFSVGRPRGVPFTSAMSGVAPARNEDLALDRPEASPPPSSSPCCPEQPAQRDGGPGSSDRRAA